jgi:hypothetical protein
MKCTTLLLVCLLAGLLILGCTLLPGRGNAAATRIAADVYATQTASAPTTTSTATTTSTPTQMPTFTPTFTPPPTPTPTATPTMQPVCTPPPCREGEVYSCPGECPGGCGTTCATPTPAPPTPAPEGWRVETGDDFTIALPERWQAVDVTAKGIEAILDKIRELDDEWARNMSAMLSDQSVAESMKFWAFDPQPAGAGFASVNVTRGDLPFAVDASAVAAQLEATYERIGLETLSTDEDLTIGGLDAARLAMRTPMGSLSMRQVQYVFVDGLTMWAVTLTVDDAVWAEYEALLAAIGESFRTTGS